MHSQRICPWEVIRAWFHKKNSRTQSHVQSRVSIDFSCTISEIQNTGHSQRISPWKVVRARCHEKI
ncbi:hypothetical protein B296_00014243 [Ensete ventricosum]|uniref:Uncharacterized protein n=1 Tax=Ensete ventricosum TaxID=4639 RepID=A0A426YWS2_ENSVE|nr:hypothetical protein B296_00014243 [Ensete ventricosum]